MTNMMTDSMITQFENPLVNIELPLLTVTPAAAMKLREVLTARNIPSHALRVFVSGGGCSGLQYGMTFEGSPSEADTLVETDGVKLVVDPTSLDYVSGATIDYVDSLMGGGFRIDNPNAVSSCGCGSSFRTKSETSAASADAGCSTCSH